MNANCFWCVIGLAVCGGCGASGWSEPADDAAALIDALEAYESSLGVVAVKFESFTTPSVEWKRPEWLLLEQSTKLSGDTPFSFLDQRFLAVDEPDYVTAYTHGMYVDSQGLRATWSFDANRGMLTQHDDYLATGVHPFRALGQSLDYRHLRFSRPASMVLRDDPSPRFLPADEQCPWPGVLAQRVTDGGWDVEARLDPEVGFAPRWIKVTRRSDGLLAEDMRVIEYRQAGDTWFPSICVLAQNYAQIVEDVDHPLSGSRSADFGRSASLRGLPDELQREDVRSAVESMQRVRILDRATRRVQGPFLVFDEGEPLFAPQIVLVREVDVNASVVQFAAKIFDPVPATAEMYNGLTGQTETAGKVLGLYRSLFPSLWPQPAGEGGSP